MNDGCRGVWTRLLVAQRSTAHGSRATGRSIRDRGVSQRSASALASGTLERRVFQAVVMKAS